MIRFETCRRCSRSFDSDLECKIGYQIVCPDCFFEDVNRDRNYRKTEAAAAETGEGTEDHQGMPPP